jgi:hypothetical protein
MFALATMLLAQEEAATFDSFLAGIVTFQFANSDL